MKEKQKTYIYGTHAVKQAQALSGLGPGPGPLGVYGGWGGDFVIYGVGRGYEHHD